MPGGEPILSIALRDAPSGTLLERLDWAEERGFQAVEFTATGEADSFHAPTIAIEDRGALAERLASFQAVTVAAPYQETFDITLVSPSAAIRRASLAEIWSVCRFTGTIGAKMQNRPLVLVRTGMPPMGMPATESDDHLSECLTALDRTAQEQHVHIGILTRDRFHRLHHLHDLHALRLRHIGLALDLPHLLAMGETVDDITTFLREQSESIVAVIVPATVEGADRVGSVLREVEYGGRTLLSSAYEARATLTHIRDAWKIALSQPMDGNSR